MKPDLLLLYLFWLLAIFSRVLNLNLQSLIYSPKLRGIWIPVLFSTWYKQKAPNTIIIHTVMKHGNPPENMQIKKSPSIGKIAPGMKIEKGEAIKNKRSSKIGLIDFFMLYGFYDSYPPDDQRKKYCC